MQNTNFMTPMYSQCSNFVYSALHVRVIYRSGDCDKGSTVEYRYLELGYLEFCKTRGVYLNKKYILMAFSNHNLALETILQVQITRSANLNL